MNLKTAGKNRGAADKNRGTADKNRVAADKNRGAADKNRGAADKNRGTADKNRVTPGIPVGYAEGGQLLKKWWRLPLVDVELMIEYPVSGPGPDGTLLSGYVDLLAAGPFGFVVVDFKTDPPPDGDPEQAYPAYAAQLRGYVDLLAPIKDPRGSVRAFLLFTASGRMFEFRV